MLHLGDDCIILAKTRSWKERSVAGNLHLIIGALKTHILYFEIPLKNKTKHERYFSCKVYIFAFGAVFSFGILFTRFSLRQCSCFFFFYISRRCCLGTTKQNKTTPLPHRFITFYRTAHYHTACCIYLNVNVLRCGALHSVLSCILLRCNVQNVAKADAGAVSDKIECSARLAPNEL